MHFTLEPIGSSRDELTVMGGHVLSLDRLPRFTFVAADRTETVVDLSMQGATINAIAGHLSGKANPGAAIALVARSGPDLVLNWLASVVAGYKPLILQYPTKKQSRAYWSASVANSISQVGIEMLIVDDLVSDMCPPGPHVITQSEIDRERASGSGPSSAIKVDEFSILQLSSGTTGHRKAMEFSAGALDRHVSDYNQILNLNPAHDTIVSWLPLYHDMGYVACFVMPMLLGVDVVMIDPIDWVSDPELLFEAIERHRGTVCYMPNFGFELMSKVPSRDLHSMRWWISCSEPVSAVTCRKFCKHMGMPDDGVSACYAMAENIFAMSIAGSMKTSVVDNVEFVSNGAPIPGVEVDIRNDQEIWLRSPTSIEQYYLGDKVAGDDGFYFTGDLGFVSDGELYVTGRQQDLVVQAGRKFMLSDIDLVLNQAYPNIKGRGVACQRYSERLGTNVVVVLIEDQKFFLRDDQYEIAAALRDAIGIDQLTVEFVPPRFLTKTSSGKFNRKKSLSDFDLALSQRGKASSIDPIDELRDSFKAAKWEPAVGSCLDSLSLTVLRIILADARIPFDPEKSLNDYEALLVARSSSSPATVESVADDADSYHIVSLCDRGVSSQFSAADLERLAGEVGASRVTMEHLCLPPSSVLLSDLVFQDWFQPRVDNEDFAATNRALQTLRRASLVLTDDAAEMYFPPHQVYSVLSHNLERNPLVDLVAVRWQRYAKFNDRLPMTIVSGGDLSLADRTSALDALSKYIEVPIFRIATIAGYSKFTEGWEFRDFSNASGALGGQKNIDGTQLFDAIAAWWKSRETPIKSCYSAQERHIVSDDLAHFCSHYVDQAYLDSVLEHFDRFCIAGQGASVPYIQRQLEKSGKPFVIVPSYAPAILENIDQDFDVVLSCGCQGQYSSDAPIVAVMRAEPGWHAKNIADPGIATGNCFVGIHRLPASASDWFCMHPLQRFAEWKDILGVRRTLGQDAERIRRERLERRRLRDERLEECDHGTKDDLMNFIRL